MTVIRGAAVFAACAVVLAAIAWASPLPDRVTDRDMYEATAAHVIVPDCTDLHCFRVLVPWMLGRLPGESLLKWKAYAVLCNAGAALAVWQLCFVLGLSTRARWIACAFSLLGFGSLYTLHDVYTGDPLMYLLGPVLTVELLRERVAMAGALAAAGVLAKEFAAAPLFMFSALATIERRYVCALRTLVAANTVFLVWLLLQLTLMLKYDYGYGDSTSTRLMSGGGVGPWFEKLTLRGAVSAVYNEFGAVYVLAIIGFWTAPSRLRRLAICAVPVALVFGYVQQPDRAWWNLHFVATPLAAVALDRAPGVLVWSTVASFAVANLRVGAQLPAAPPARLALAVSLVLAIAGVLAGWRSRSTGQPTPASAAAA